MKEAGDGDDRPPDRARARGGRQRDRAGRGASATCRSCAGGSRSTPPASSPTTECWPECSHDTTRSLHAVPRGRHLLRRPRLRAGARRGRPPAPGGQHRPAQCRSTHGRRRPRHRRRSRRVSPRRSPSTRSAFENTDGRRVSLGATHDRDRAPTARSASRPRTSTGTATRRVVPRPSPATSPGSRTRRAAPGGRGHTGHGRDRTRRGFSVAADLDRDGDHDLSYASGLN